MVAIASSSSLGNKLHERWRFAGCSNPVAAFDAQGNLFVADAGNNRVLKLSERGDSLGAVSGTGWGDSQFDDPCAVATRGVDVFVADRGNHRVQRFDRNLNFVAALATRDNVRPEERFGFPRGLAVSQEGDLYVLDGENRRIVAFTPFGQFARSFGSTDAGAQQLADPRCLCVDDAGFISVVDGGTVKRFDAFGNPRGVGQLEGVQWCAADSGRCAVQIASSIVRLPDAAVRWELPSGFTWRGFAVGRDAIVAWTDHEIVFFDSMP